MTPPTLSQRDAVDSVRWPAHALFGLGFTVDACGYYLLRYRAYADRCSTVEWVTLEDEGGDDDGDK